MAKELIDVRGLNQTYRALREVAPDLSRALYRDVGSMLKQRVTAAKGRAGALAPGPAPHFAAATRLTKTKKKYGGNGRRGLFGFAAITGHPVANIIDLAEKSSTPQGATLVKTLRARYGPAPRYLGREFLGEANRAAISREADQITSRYIDALNTRIEQNAKAGAV